MAPVVWLGVVPSPTGKDCEVVCDDSKEVKVLVVTDVEDCVCAKSCELPSVMAVGMVVSLLEPAVFLPGVVNVAQ